jgi:hypothetical protein
MYARAAKLGRLSCLSKARASLSVRVARHTATIKLIRTFTDLTPTGIELDGVPGYDDMVKQGIGST